MKFLEAQAVLRRFKGGDALNFRLAMSGTHEPLDVYLKASAAVKGREANVETIPFNTLQQYLAGPKSGDVTEAMLLLPWDLVPELDWRSGIPAGPATLADMVDGARGIVAAVAARRPALVAYIPAPVPPILADAGAQRALTATVHALGAALASATLDADAFSLAAYLASGCPIRGGALGDVATSVVNGVIGAAADGAYKVLITDFDNVMWSGVVGEDGVDGISATAAGRGYRHFIYQTMLVALKNSGVLLVGVTRNHPDDALAPLRKGAFPLVEDDFIAVVASYHAKSAQLRQIASDLNLGLDAFVFVDDNPIELAEVAAELSGFRCIPFPAGDDELPDFLHELRRAFSRSSVTEVDRDRTAMYRRRLEGMAPVESSGAGLAAFLGGLQMQLTVQERSSGDHERALQLINKTNQFNLNGQRLTGQELEARLASGARLWTATLHDKTGGHGEILACLVSRDGLVESLVMSCRVFQRRIEHAFLCWLLRNDVAPKAFRFSETSRNEPIRQFFADSAFSPAAGDAPIEFDSAAFLANHADDLALFRINDGK